MPGKGRRMASRQAELGRRRRRQNRGAGTAVADPPESAPSPAATLTAAQDSPAPAAPQPRAAVSAAPRSGSRTRFDRPTAYNYVKPEMRRIFIMSGVLLAGLIGLSFVLPLVP